MHYSQATLCIKPHILYRHTHTNKEDIADEVWVNTLHHGVRGYTGTSPSHPSSSASLHPAPPSNPPHNLSLQLEPASHTHLLSLLLSHSLFPSCSHGFIVLSVTPFPLFSLSPPLPRPLLSLVYLSSSSFS